MIGDLFDSPWKILIVAVVLIVLFGSRKLPDAARSLGKSMRILKTEVQDLHHDEPDEATPAQAVAARRQHQQQIERAAAADPRPAAAAVRGRDDGSQRRTAERAAADAAAGLSPLRSRNRPWRSWVTPSRARACSARASCRCTSPPNPDGRMPLMEHIRELRNRLLKVAGHAGHRHGHRVHPAGLQPALAPFVRAPVPAGRARGQRQPDRHRRARPVHAAGADRVLLRR